MNDANLKESAWQDFFARLKRGEIPDDQIGPAIVHLAKPFDATRIQTARDTILTFLNHQNAWARHEAMWKLGDKLGDRRDVYRVCHRPRIAPKTP
jgi:hypothetical protein